jgi:hypothetical protein
MQGMLSLNGISVESVARMYFSKNPKHENAVIVMSGTMKFGTEGVEAREGVLL